MYTISEGFKAGALLLSKLAEATKTKSDGGATITKNEIVNIAVEVLTLVGIDVADDDED